MFCSKYFEFQLGWAQVLATLEADPYLKELFAGGVEIPVAPEMSGQLMRGDASMFSGVAPAAVAAQSNYQQIDPNRAYQQNVVEGSQVVPMQHAAPLQQGSAPDLFDFELDLEALGVDTDD
jgi:hypothetical protein